MSLSVSSSSLDKKNSLNIHSSWEHFGKDQVDIKLSIMKPNKS